MTIKQRTFLSILPLWLFGLVFIFPGRVATAAEKTDMPPSVRILLHKVRACMEKEEYPSAIALILERQKKSKAGKQEAACTHPKVCLALGNCHLLLKQYSQAETAYTDALKLDPEMMDARLNLAKVYTDTNNYPKAARAFALAYDLSAPKAAEYLYYSAVMTLMEGKAGAASTILDRLFAAHPEKVTRQWRETYANALIRAEYWKKAIPVVKQLAMETDGEDKIRWQETLLQIFLTTDDLKRARDWATSLAREAPAQARWWKALVHIHLSLDNYDKALDCMIIYGFAAPLSAPEKKLLADLSLQLGIPARAIGMYEDILAGDAPCKPKERQNLIQRLINAFRQTGQLDRALAVLDGVSAQDCTAELLMLKGDLLYEAKDFKAADTAYRLAARGNCPQRGQAWLMAGYAAWQCNNLPASKTAFEQAARFKRHRKDAMAAMAQLEKTARL